MANVIIDDANLRNIANAIREKNGLTDTYKPSDMPQAILDIVSGGETSLVDMVYGNYGVSKEEYPYLEVVCIPNSKRMDVYFTKGIQRFTNGIIRYTNCLHAYKSGVVVDNLDDVAAVVELAMSVFTVSNFSNKPSWDVTDNASFVHYINFENIGFLGTVYEIPSGSSNGIEKIEKLIDESGVLGSTEGTVTEKVEQLIDKAEDENLWYNCLADNTNATKVFYNYQLSKLPRLPALKTTSLLMFFAYARMTTIDFYIDIASTNLISMSSVFGACGNLTSMVGINTAKGNDLSKMFTDCLVLETIQEPLDFSNATNLTNVFYKCYKLQNIKFVEETIKLSISFAFSPLLSADSKQSIINGLATVETAQTFTVYSEDMLTDEQKATVTEKGWTLAYTIS